MADAADPDGLETWYLAFPGLGLVCDKNYLSEIFAGNSSVLDGQSTSLDLVSIPFGTSQVQS